MIARSNVTPVRVGIVGAGANTREMHIPGLQAIQGVDVVSVCNRSRESSTRVAKTFGIPTVYDSWEALVAADDTDAIMIGTWPYLHAPVTLAALKAGKHVLCEARMAMNYDEARAMLAAATARPELVTQVVPAPFTLSVDATIQRLIQEGFLGRLAAVNIRANGGSFVDPAGPLTWRRDRELSGNNIMALGIWYETMMRWVGEATRVCALGKTLVERRPDPVTGDLRRVAIPEHLDVLADLRNGAQAHLQFSSVTGLVPDNSATLIGSEGTLRFTGGQLLGARRGEDALVPIEIPESEAQAWRVEAEFIGAIRGTESVKLTTFETGARYMAFTDAVTQSLHLKRSTDVPT